MEFLTWIRSYISDIFNQFDIECTNYWLCAPFVKFSLHNMLYSAVSTILNTLKLIDSKLYTILYTIIAAIFNGIVYNSYSKKVTNYIQEMLKYFRSTKTPFFACYFKRNSCKKGITQIPINCFLFTKIKEFYYSSNNTDVKVHYVLGKVIEPLGTFIYPLTYTDTKLSGIGYILDSISEFFRPSEMMTVCSVELSSISKFQQFLNLIKRVSTFTDPTFNFKVDTTVKCIQMRTGERFYSLSFGK